MSTRSLHKAMALVVSLGLLLGACGPKPTPTSTIAPTPLPYTPPPPEAVPVVVVQRTPERGEELSPDGAIELIFDRAMDHGSVEAAFRLSPEVGGDFEWADERTVRFKPARDLKRDAEYQATLGPEAKGTDGNPLDGEYRFRFRTVGYLQVAQVIPAPDTQDVEATGIVTVIFNRPVVPLVAVSDPDYAGLPDPLTFDPPIEGDGEWLNTSIYVFTPAEALAGGTTYTARVAAGLADTSGGVLAEEYAWSFTTQPPQVVWVSPGEESTLVSVDTAVQVTFNMPVTCGTAAQAFTLSTVRTSVPGTSTCLRETLVFTPDARLDFDTTYSARVDTGVQSAGGGAGMREPYEWRFTTVPLPRIVGTRPYDGQQDAWSYTDFQILFNTPINPDTVLPNLGMTPPLSPSLVYTYFNTWDSTFVLGFGAQPSTDYVVRMGPDIADPYGNKTGQELTVRFRTADLPPSFQIHVPGTLGTYDAHQPARVVAGHVNADRLDLSLYRLDLAALFPAVQNWWEYEPSAAPIRQWSVSLSAPLNETGYVLVDLAEGGGTLEPGLYMLDARAPGVEYDRWSHRKLLSVSEYSVTLKKSRDELWAWVTDLASGRPAGGLALSAEGSGGNLFGTAATGADGLARFSLGPAYYYDAVYVVSEEPFVVGGTGWEWSAGIGPWDFGLQEEVAYGAHRAHMYTDRPIYRPGQVVYFRGILRAEDDVRYRLPAAETIQVIIYDAAGEEIYRETLPLDGFGAFHGELQLADGAALGQYGINATLGDESFYADFLVAAYRPPEFEVVVTPEQTELAAGQPTEASAEVRYFFGGPVADANVEWNVLSAPYRFEPAQFGRYDFTDEDDPWLCRWCWWQEPPAPDVVLSGSGTTGADGRITIGLPTEVMTGGKRLTVEATVYGRDGQVISGRADVVVHQGEFYAGLAPQQYVGKAGEELAVDVVTVDWAGERLPDRALEVEVYRREWVNTFVEDEFGGGTWEWETVDTLVYTGTLSTDADAEGILTFTPAEGGSYRVAVSGRDAQERLVRSSTWVWVSGDEYVSWRRENNDRITLISDKSTYVSGETAEILIPSPFAGEQWAWITVERGGILQQEVVRLESNSTVYRLPITTGHVPNIYFSVVIVKGPDTGEPVATHKVGYVMLAVEPTEQELAIAATPSVEQAQPGDTVSFDVEARDASGEPVRAAFSLDLVDKAVLSLKPRTPDAILNAFYGQRGLGVATSSGLAISVNRLLQEQMKDVAERAALQGMGRGGGGEAEAPAAMPSATAMPMEFAAEDVALRAPALPAGVQLREEFADTALWEAAVVTDQTGHASVEVKLPDNLTTWVLRGVGVTADTKVGEATADLLVTKPLLIRPVAPRFFVVGDEAQLAALVSNNTDEALETTVTLHATGVTLDATRTTQYEVQITIPAHSERKVAWWVTVEDVAAADVAMSAVAGTYSDAARPRLTTGPEGTLLVHRYAAPEIVGTGGQLVGEETRTEVIALPPKYDDRQGALSVRLDPSLAAGMRDGLTYLEHFPYECTEQTVSRFLPNVLTYRALQELEIQDVELEARLPGLVEQGLNKLYLQQHADGGWGWWAEGESNPYLTAYVVFALAKAREAGFEVREGVIESGVGFLEGALVRARDLESYREANRQAFILYAMAEAGKTGRASEYVADLYDRREKLSHYGRAFLALTLGLIEGNDARIRTLLSDIQNAAILSATGAHWEEADYDWWAMNTDTRSTAVILDAVARLDPQNALIQQVVRWLMVARQDGIWETTQETAWALIALTDWMAVTGELEGEYDYGVSLNDEVLAEGAVTPDTVDEPVLLQVAIADLLRDAGNRLAIGRGPGEGRLYYTAHLKVYLPVEEIEPLDRGVFVTRQYCSPMNNGTMNNETMNNEQTTPGRCEEVDEAQVGDVVQVRLTVIAPHDLYYVVVEDPLPAGAEGIDPSLATTSELAQEPNLMRETEEQPLYGWYSWWWRWYSRSEMRDDKVVLFADYLAAGTYEYTYTFRATLPGEYRVIPTTAHEFYFPEVFGRADGRLFTITEGK